MTSPMLPDGLTLWMMAGVGALLAGALLQLVLAATGRRSRTAEAARDHAERALRKDMLTLAQENLGLSARLARLEAGVSRYRAQARTLAPAVPTTTPLHTRTRPTVLSPVESAMPAEPAYAVAARLSRRGASVEEIIEACCLTRGEAELIHKLYVRQPDPDGIPVVSRTIPSEA